ncbi:hypothetical protein SpCBS45565_g03519 [Spizellomyces sp. 'palustris']|nr:hypothetical protein SpCBS45565_g03519 [Spizellomyces sp. 'palustris']
MPQNEKGNIRTALGGRKQEGLKKDVKLEVEEDEIPGDLEVAESDRTSESDGSKDSEGESDEEEAEGAYLRSVSRKGQGATPKRKGVLDSRFVLPNDETQDSDGRASSSGDSDDEVEGNSESEDDHDDDNSEGQDLSTLPDPDNSIITDPQALTLPPLSSAKPLTAKSLAKFQSKVDATGVIYLSRVPPFMRPIKLRQLLARFGAIGRIYLAPEDPRIAARRKKYRHNKRQNYTEGWVEFLDKKVARQVATLLNGKQIGGKKRSFYYDDIWNMKYLPRFKWNHLTEQIAYELKVREQRLKTEMAQAKRENKAYVKNVGKAKMVEAIEERKRQKKRKAGDEIGKDDAATSTLNADETTAIRRRFKQRKVVDSDAKATAAGPSVKKAAVLSKLFG